MIELLFCGTVGVGVLGKREAAENCVISGLMNEMLVLLLQSNDAKVSCASADPHLNAGSCDLESAQRIHVTPSAQYPSFLKQLTKSHLSGKFYLGLPKKFCDAHLPCHDDTIILVDEDDQEYKTKYSVRKNRLSGGWRGFTTAHKLIEGDALIFHLIESCRFRVYIVRAGKLAEDDGAVGYQTPDFQNPLAIVKVEQRIEESDVGGKAMRVCPDSPEVDSHQETKRARIIPYNKLSTAQTGNGIDQLDSNVLQGISNSAPDAKFKDMKDFEAFNIKLGDQVLDSEVPVDIRTRYYNLCCSQKMFLHDRLIKALSSKLAVAVISETVDIADAIRSAIPTTSLYHLQSWEKTLRAFEDLGMAVGFLRNRLHKLIGLSHDYLSSLESRRSKVAQADKEISNLEGASWNSKGLVQNLAAEVKSLILKNEMVGLEFQQLAGAPW